MKQEEPVNPERMLQAINEAYLEAGGQPVYRRATSEEEREAALLALEQAAYAQGVRAGRALLSPELCPLSGILAEHWERGRMKGLAEAFARVR